MIEELKKCIYLTGFIVIFMIGLFSVCDYGFNKFLTLFENETITIENAEARTTERGDKLEGEADRQEVPRTSTVDERIRDIADQESFSEVDKLIAIAKCESGLNPDADTNPTNNSFDRGLYQISRKWHPEVSDECASDVECSTREAIRIQKKAGWEAWACYNKYGF